MPSEAQTDSALTKALADTLRLLARPAVDSGRVASPAAEVRMIRLGSAAGGFMFGMLLGGFAGHEIKGEDCRGNCRARTGDGLLTGGALGGALGAALGAAFLDLGSPCTFDSRILRTVAGASIGASLLFAAAGGTEKRRGTSAFFVPIGAIGGSLGSLGRCWRPRP